MSTWQQQPPVGYYPGPQDPAGGPGFYPPQAGFPTVPPQPGGYPAQPSGFPQQPGGFPQQTGGYPQQPPPAYTGAAPAGMPYGAMPQSGQPPYTAPPPMHPSAASYGASYNDSNLTGPDNFEFSSKTIRHGFIRKVYGILMVQLAITVGFVSLFVFHQPTKKYVQSHPAMFIVAFVTVFVTIIAMSCCENIRRKSPTNFIFLGIFTMAESFLVGTLASTYAPDAVLMAVAIATVVCFALTVFSFQTKWDFTVLSGSLFVILIVFMLFGFICMIFPGKILQLVYASVGVVLFSIYLVYDTQMMMGGKHKYSISPEEYVFAALSLYLDIINIFIYLLHIIGVSRE